MRWTGIEYSKIHKIGKFFENPKLQALLTPEEMRQFAAITDNLALKRELAFYGSDDMGAPELFDRDAAQKALDECRLIVGRAEKIVFSQEEIKNVARENKSSVSSETAEDKSKGKSGA